MTKKNLLNIGIVAVVLSVIIGFSMKYNNKNTDNNDADKMLKVESVPIKTSVGWGYNILVDHKIFIHQEYIPAVQGKKPFASEEDALKTADVAIHKIVNGRQPIITIKELDSLHIAMQ